MSEATAEPPAPAEEQPKLRPANENPWYLLATLHGKQSGEERGEIDYDLHARTAEPGTATWQPSPSRRCSKQQER